MLNVGRAHAVFKVPAAILAPGLERIAGRNADLVSGGAYHGVVGDPIGVGTEQVQPRTNRVAARRHFGLRSQALLAAAARIVEFNAAVIANFRKELLIEERSIGGKLR